MTLLFGLFSMVVLTQSCEVDKCADVECLNNGVCIEGTCDCPDGVEGTTCQTHCSEAIIGIWTVTDASVFCDFATYEFTKGSNNSEISLNINSGVLTGTGTLSSNCATMTYSANGSGTVTFNRNTLMDVRSSGCEYIAENNR